MKNFTRYAALVMMTAAGSSTALAQEIGPIATGLASSVDAAQPLDTQTGLKQPSNESHYRTEYSIGDILAAVSEDMTMELEALIARQLHTPGPREEQPETQLVNAY
jgi:hypothetical protein